MNWGNKILIAFIVFGTGMTFLVIRSMQTNFDLVEKDYYKKEIGYQEIIDGTKRANALTSTAEFSKHENVIRLKLPPEMKNKTVTGEIWFYCAYDEKKDKKIELKVTADGLQEFQQNIISPGNYTVKINWTAGGKNYYAEKPLTVF
ncbi:MAG: hypothetical protein FJY20_04405 [Bacteroidetes bacterium]|nr:hypothetical protein [Bacteroidota bacterium]